MLLLSVSMQVMGDTLFSERGIGVIFPRSPRPFLGASLAATARMGHARRGRCRMRSRLLYKKRPRGDRNRIRTFSVRLPQGGHQGLFDPSMPPRLVPKSGTGTQKINDTSPNNAVRPGRHHMPCQGLPFMQGRYIRTSIFIAIPRSASR